MMNANEPAAVNTTPELGAKSIMLVDDSFVLRDRLALAFQERGFRVLGRWQLRRSTDCVSPGANRFGRARPAYAGQARYGAHSRTEKDQSRNQDPDLVRIRVDRHGHRCYTPGRNQLPPQAC